MRVTIYDVAKKAGVGIGTVSRVINHSPQITEETKKKVLKAIKELHYQPHSVAQSLARKRTNTIGCIIPFFTGYFFVELLRGIQRKITEYNYDLILYSVDRTHKKETFLSRVLKERRVDGVLLVSVEITNAFAGKFSKSQFPIVLVDSYHSDLDSITVDNIEGAYVATKHLIDLGFQRVAMIDGQLKSFPAKLRLRGYKKALKEHNFPFRDEYFVACDFVDEADGFNKEAGYAAMKQLLDLKGGTPEAVFVSSDIQAIGAIHAIKERGWKVPDDIAVVGFDDIELARYVGLTTMQQPIMEMGELAVDRLISRIAGDAVSDFKRCFHTKLVLRESSGCAAHSAC
ncbi:MAG: LacI family DNA-binding transcriptional regulator [bacterium]